MSCVQRSAAVRHSIKPHPMQRLIVTGIIVAFSVSVPKPVQAVAKQSGVEIYSSAIIYQVIDEVRRRVTDLLPQEYEKKITGEAKVQELFEIHKGRRIEKVVGGCRVTTGVIERSKTVQVVRGGEVLFEGLNLIPWLLWFLIALQAKWKHSSTAEMTSRRQRKIQSAG
jgi:hypothetical protein